LSFIGATYSGNKGAAGMLRAAVGSLMERMPDDTEYSVLSLYPSRDRDRKQSGVRIVPCRLLPHLLLLSSLALLYRLFSWFGPVRRVLAVFPPLKALVGSDVLLDLSGISFVDGRTATLFYNAACILPAILVGTPVIKLSQALGPFRRFPNRQLASILLRRMEHIYARGAGTAANLRELGLENWSPAHDLAFALGPVETIPSEDPPVIGVLPSRVMQQCCKNSGIEYLRVMAGALNAYLEKDDRARVVVMAHSNLGPDTESRNNDYRVCRELHGMLPPERTALLVEDLGPEELRAEIGGCTVCIASRFHGMISALCTGTPVLVTAWSHKYREVLESFECSEWVVDMPGMTQENLLEMLRRIMERRVTVRESILRHLPAVRESAEDQLREVSRLIMSPVPEVRGIGRTARRLHGEFYAGVFRSGCIGYSIAPSLRRNCASGGLVTSLLAGRMERGITSGAVVAGMEYGEDGPQPVSRLATSREELEGLAGSVYTDFDHIGGIRRLLHEHEGTYDLVVLPCQARALRALMEKDALLRSRTGLLIGLWCGHATGPGLLRDILRRWGVDGADVKRFRYRKGHWRGRSVVELEDGSRIERSFSRNYGLFQNLYVDCMPRCLSCTDHFASQSDLSFGDCWIRSEKRSNMKKTMAVALTPEGEAVLERLGEDPGIVISGVDPAMAVQAQKRAVVWHTYGCAGRSSLSRLFGMDVSCGLDIRPRINDLVSAFIILSTVKLFSGPLRKFLLGLPWWVHYPAMAFQKLMLNR